MDALLFMLDDRRFALPARDLVEIVRAASVRPIPNAPRVVLGALDFRGTLTVVIDLRARLGLPPQPIGLEDHFIIARAGARTVALVVDRAESYATLDESKLDAPSAVSPHLQHLAGVSRTDDGLVVIVDLEAFLSEAEEASLEAALALA